MKKRMAYLLAGSMLLSALAGCSSSSSTTETATTTDSSSTTTSTDTASAEPVTLKIITGGDYSAPLQTYIDAYEAANPNVTIEIEESSGTDLTSKINLAHASGDDYDLMWVDGSLFETYVQAGVLTSLTDYVADSEIDIEANFNAQVMDAAYVNDDLYGISVAPGTRVLAYNIHMLEDNGFEVPTTQDEILEICEYLYNLDGTYSFVRVLDNVTNLPYAEGGFWMSNGARIYTDNGDGTYTAVCDSEEMIESLEFWVEMAKYMPADVNYSSTEVRELFSQERSAFYVFGAWEYSLLGDLVYGEDFGLMNIPGPEQVSTLGGWYLGIGDGSENKDVAWDFMETYYNDPAMQAVCSLTQPGDLRAYDYAPFNDEKYDVYLETMENCELPMPVHVNSAKVQTAWFDAFNEILIGGADIETTLTAVCEEIQDILDDV